MSGCMTTQSVEFSEIDILLGSLKDYGTKSCLFESQLILIFFKIHDFIQFRFFLCF